MSLQHRRAINRIVDNSIICFNSQGNSKKITWMNLLEGDPYDQARQRRFQLLITPSTFNHILFFDVVPDKPFHQQLHIFNKFTNRKMTPAQPSVEQTTNTHNTLPANNSNKMIINLIMVNSNDNKSLPFR